jgi:hypothetical protein
MQSSKGQQWPTSILWTAFGRRVPGNFQMDRELFARKRGHNWVYAALGAVVAVILVVGIGPPGELLAHATVCELGPQLGVYTVWTPIQVINVPDGGGVAYGASEWNVTVRSGSLVLNPLQNWTGSLVGTIGGGSGPNRSGLWVEYGDFNWTFYEARNSSVVNQAPGPCTQAYVAQITVPGGACGGWDIVGLADNATDTVEPHVWNGTAGFNGTEDYSDCPVQTPGTYVTFDSSMHTAGSGAMAGVDWNLCGDTGHRTLALSGVAQVPEVLHVPYGGGGISVSATLLWYDAPGGFGYLGPSTSYQVPAGWNWTLAPVGPASFPIEPIQDLPSLVAFIRAPC